MHELDLLDLGGNFFCYKITILKTAFCIYLIYLCLKWNFIDMCDKNVKKEVIKDSNTSSQHCS